MVVSLCVLYTYSYFPLCSLQRSVKLATANARLISRRTCRAWRAHDHPSRRDHMTDASLRGNQPRVLLVPRYSQSPRDCLVSHPALAFNNAASRARKSACRVEQVPTPRRATPGLEPMGQQLIQHYQHPTDRYRHRQDTHTAHILLIWVCF